MKKQFILIAAVIGLLAACPNPSDNQGNPDNLGNPGNQDNPGKTFIVFDNTQGICAVTVYDSYQRREQDKAAEVPAGQRSAEIEWTPGVSAPFYFSYAIKLKGVNGFTLNYVPEIGKDQIAITIDSGRKTTIPIPRLDETVPSFDVSLSAGSYLLIQNGSSIPFSLQRGDTPVPPPVNSGGQGQYAVNPGPALLYRLLVGADYYQFPVADFKAGCAYCFVFNGNTITLDSEPVELTLENVAGFSPLLKLTPGLFRGAKKIGAQNLADSLVYISSNAASGDRFYIVLGEDETVSYNVLDYSGKTVEITLFGYGGKKTIRSSFYVNAGVTLNLNENITLRGHNFIYRSGNLIMSKGAEIINADSGVYNNKGGSFTMNGGEIYGGVYNEGTFTMNGGEISDNTVEDSGGGVYNKGGIFTMSGGKISGNTASSGGGVYNDGGTFTMSGGEISGNTASYDGGGVYNNEGSFTMSGGKISGNTASYDGGGVYVNKGSFKKLSPNGGGGGIIYGDDEADVNAEGLPLRNDGQAVFYRYNSSLLRRNTTAWETDEINTETGRGLSADGNPPFGQ